MNPHKKINWIFLFFVCLAPFLAGQDEAIEVKLATEQPLLPLYLLPINKGKGSFDDAYLNKLDGILQYDLTHNGSTELLSRNPSKELHAGTNIDDPTTANYWKALGPAYVVRIEVANEAVSALVLAPATRNLTSIAPLPLTGNLIQDRQQIHRLADALHRAFTGEPGIASQRILYTYKYQSPRAGKDGWCSEVWESDYDGANARKILSDDCGYCVTPTYIPPKKGCQSAALLYVSYKNGQPKIYISPLKGGVPMRLTTLRGNQLMPAISPQRDQIAFISDITGNPDLFLQSFSCESGAVGKPRQIFTARHATQGSPTFSPDGRKIAFVSNKDGSARIYVMNIPSPNTKLSDVKVQLISHANRESSAPQWSPDGTKLAYCARNGGNRQIWIYDFNTNEEWSLTNGPIDKENPSWAPNSTHILYNTTGKGGGNLYLINIVQCKPVKIHEGPGEKHYPCWQPQA